MISVKSHWVSNWASHRENGPLESRARWPACFGPYARNAISDQNEPLAMPHKYRHGRRAAQITQSSRVLRANRSALRECVNWRAGLIWTLSRTADSLLPRELPQTTGTDRHAVAMQLSVRCSMNVLYLNVHRRNVRSILVAESRLLFA